MEHVEVLRDLSEVCRAAIKAGDWKVDGACDPDAALRRADAAIASLSAPQPPAEAQAQGGGEVVAEVVLHNNLLYGRLSRDLPVGTKLYTAPPSAPVGVEGLIEDWESDLAEDKRDGVSEVAIRVQEIHLDQLRALAQQPAAVDGAMVERAAKELRDLHREFGDGADLPEKIAREIAEAVVVAALAAQQGDSHD